MTNSSGKVVAYDFDKNPYETDVADLQWRPAAYAVIIKDSKILLLRQINGYDLPGGGLEKGESPEEAVVREVKEETGAVVKDPKIIYVGTSFFKPTAKDRYVQSVSIYYQCTFVGGELSTEGFDEAEKVYAEEPEWVPLEKLPGIKIGSTVDYRPHIKPCIEAYENSGD